jgi:hypothetical protein
MSWKTLLSQSLLTVVLLLVGLRLFTSNHANQLGAFQESLFGKIQLIESHLSKIESAVADPQRGSGRASGQPAQTMGLDEINGRLQAIEESLARMEHTDLPPGPPRAAIPLPTPPTSIMPAEKGLVGAPNPLAWMQQLSDAKRQQVEDVFKEQGQAMRGLFSGGIPANPEVVKETMAQHDQELKQKLRAVLDDQEYQSFLNSHPKPPTIAAPPLLPKK